jgi:hypothetical protein
MDLKHINHRIVCEETLEEARQDVERIQAGPSVSWPDSSIWKPEFEFVCEIAGKLPADDLAYIIAYVRQCDEDGRQLDYIECRLNARKNDQEELLCVRRQTNGTDVAFI